MVDDARPRAVLTDSSIFERTREWGTSLPETADWLWLDTGRVPPEDAAGWTETYAEPGALAFLQYTSGSTSAPKGVMVSHGNLAANQRLITAGFRQDERSVVAGWLPVYHDMGLIGNILQPLWSGSRCVLMSPLTFLQKPVRWLEAISRYRATTSGGPNFAYELCVDKITEEEKAGLDLRSWEVAFNGAEPVRAETLDRFVSAFAACGFRRAAFAPCFGLAESTLLVTVSRPGEEPRVLPFDSAALEQGGALPAVPGAPSRPLVGCGSAPQGQGAEVRIVDPESGTPCAEGRVGEIWVASASVALGYWQRADSAETFGARLRGEEEPRYLRTGDLGFLSGDDLFVTGRIKDLIIIRGRNHYPQDVELAAERSHPELRPGCGAAFSVERAGEERLVVVQEVERRLKAAPGEVVDAIRQAVTEELEIAVDDVVLIRPGSLPKTTSGKVQRRLCRTLYLEDRLEVVGRAASRSAAVPEALPAVAGETGDPLRVARLSALREIAAQVLRIDPASLDPARPLTLHGLDSLAAFEMKSRVEAALGIVLEPSDLLEGASLEEIAGALPAGAAAPAAAEPEALAEGPAMTLGQRAIWFLQRLEPRASAYNLAAAFRVRSSLDLPAFERALAELMERHESLRSFFPEGEGSEPVRRVAPAASGQGAVSVQRVDASEWDAGELAERLAEAANRPFDLASGPLLRVELFTAGAHGDSCLLFAVHHIVADLQSLLVVASDLSRLYERESPGGTGLPPLPAPAAVFGRYAAWEERQAFGLEAAAHWSYWSGALGGDLPDLDLPTDRPRQRRQRFVGAGRSSRLDPGLAGGVAALARQRGTTLFAALLAAFQSVLHRHSGLDDVLVGTPVSCRAAARAGETVGYLVNPVALRGRFAGSPVFAEALAGAQTALAGALRHQGFPFPLLVERLRANRDSARSPLFQALFVLHRSQGAEDALLADLALGEPGARWNLGGAVLEAAPLEVRASQFDLSLAAAESRGELVLRLVFDSDLFDGSTVERMLGHFRTLLAAAVADPDRRVEELPLLTPAEQAQLAAWNGTDAGFSRQACVHELFARQADRTPGAVAVAWEEEKISYRELAGRAAAVARRLRGLGVRPDSRVGLLLGRTPELLSGLLGSLGAGAGFVPLDPRYPALRLEWMARDAGLSVLAVDSSTAGLLPDLGLPLLVLGEGAVETAPASELVPPAARALPENVAYVLYTSGSTGRPKGVEVQHRALVNVLEDIAREAALGPEDVVLSFTTPSFDIGILELLLPLITGGRLELVPTETGRDGAALAAALAAHRPTLTQATPATWSLLLEDPPSRMPDLKAFCGGEAMSGAVADGLRALAGRAWNMYGPSETAVYSVIFDLAKGAGAPPIGRPVANTRCHVLSAAREPVPVGVPGELCIAGEGVGRGYLGRPDLTAERFLPDPFSPWPGGRLYRTGDLARWRSDGEIEYLGRIDRQVKIRGYRIELGEIQELLLSHPGVRGAVVVARPDPAGEKRLAAYYVPAKPPPSLAELDGFLRERLPEFMVPAAFVALESFPLMPNGKVDVRALPEPASAGRSDGEPARSPLEQWVLEIWAGVLGLERVGLRDNFFAVGGHSLKAAQVIARVRKVFGVDLPLHTLFEAPDAAAFARRIEEARGSSVPSRAREPLTAGGAVDVSSAQRRLWLLDRLQPGLAAYSMPAAVDLRGSLDAAALAASLGEIVHRHEVLRTRYPAEPAGEPVPVVEPAAPFSLALADLSGLPEPAAEGRRLARREAALPFDLAAGPVLRCRLLRLAPEHHVLLVTVHHIAADGGSLELFAAELDGLYEAFAAGAPSPLPPLPFQYGEYAAWERRGLTAEARAFHLEHWRARLGPAEPLELPADHPPRPVQSFRGVRASSLLSGEPAASALALARREGLTPFVVLGAAFALLLQRYTRQDVIVLGTPLDGRERVELEPLIGLFVQLLPLPLRIAEEAAGLALLRQVRDELLEAWEHREFPFESLVQELQAPVLAGRAQLVQATLAYERAPEARRIGPLAARVEETYNGTAKFDLSLFARESAGGLALSLEANADLFERATAQRMLGHFERFLVELAASPEAPLAALSLLSGPERQQLSLEWNDTAVLHALEGTVCDAFEARAAAAPDSVAVVTDETVLTYGELDRRANGLAAMLAGLGVRPESLAAVLLPRSPELVLAVLAVLKTGGAYLPLDPSHPAERIDAMLADSGARVLITADGLTAGDLGFTGSLLEIHRALAEAPEAAAPPRRGLTAASLAYVIYTSGSTGRPKGVALSHGGLANLVAWHLRAYEVNHGVNRSDRGSLVASPAFDASVWEMWPCLCAGAGLAPLAPARAASPAALAADLARLGVTLSFLPTPLAEALLGEPGVPLPAALRVLLTGGDRLKRSYPEAAAVLVNHYGPTESTVVATAAPVTGDRRGAAPPIGRPIDNLRAHVLDGRLRPVPVGVPGELYIAGAGLARGYLGQPAATAERFIPSPFAAEPGERLYRTGDRVRLLADGNLEFLGRADRQVKIRGVRIEPGEIESLLLVHPEVHQAVVTVADDPGLGPFLCAYVVPRDPGTSPSSADLRGWIRTGLPEPMVPSAFVFLPALPLSANGKVDLRALPVPDRAGDTGEDAPLRSPLEEILAGIWCELLGRSRIGAHADFFELGGHSLQVARLQARIYEELGVELPLETIFLRSSLAGLAEAVAERLVESLGEETLRNLFTTTLPVSDLSSV